MFLIYLTRFIEVFCGLTLILLLVHIFLLWILSFLGFPYFQTQWLDKYLFSVIALWGIAYALIKNAHIRMDVFSCQFSQYHQVIVKIITLLLVIFPIVFDVWVEMRVFDWSMFWTDPWKIMSISWIWIFGCLWILCIAGVFLVLAGQGFQLKHGFRK